MGENGGGGGGSEEEEGAKGGAGGAADATEKDAGAGGGVVGSIAGGGGGGEDGEASAVVHGDADAHGRYDDHAGETNWSHGVVSAGDRKALRRSQEDIPRRKKPSVHDSNNAAGAAVTPRTPQLQLGISVQRVGKVASTHVDRADRALWDKTRSF